MDKALDFFKQIDQDVFLEAVGIAAKVESGEIETANPNNKKFTLDGDLYSFGDTPLVRVMGAINDRYKEDGPAIAMRLWAMSDIYQDDRFAAFFDEERGVSTDLLSLVARAPFSNNAMDLDWIAEHMEEAG